ncbi:acyl-CoA dehydrogenase family protein [Bordetella bronchiseptica]|uniref:Acyl-CoA dehydrogenase n=4 Tax=Bordetella bronchiseptica TaxID=518 RepID=A0ABR4R763_BORBO|nr:acyl-CoA dehydrogenase family protein [Bordetella bronchiseptica]KAK68268.1 putative acyl-CoA dehydrogenase [Bordetella bronchiseptica 980-2]SHS23127.1 acyl-CoA dehydrogenase [Mycobacteroides abscessus subsp. abscessus]AMG87184.1 acyl-CoA dehydrogenase [Bordetella bronchiseptica]AWP73521.1 acyl-CoA dehydrogenase [Bordetella bronchiseptica]AWP83161.1 acyl-CoA dehydrogenase [Bordetella bronchiseptica]
MIDIAKSYQCSPALWRDRVDPAFLRELRRVVADTVLPEAEAIDRQDVYPVQIIKAMARRGYTSLTLPRQWGGGAAPYGHCAAVFEEASYGSAAVGISLITILQAQTLINQFGAESLKAAVLPEFAQGLITAYALTEANHGSDIRSLDTKARRGAGGWTLEGRKSFITSGSAAEAYIVLAETDHGVSTFFVRRDMPGVSTFDGPTSGTFGLRNGPHVDLILDGVVVPDDHLIGVEGKGVRQAVTTLDFSRTMAGAISLGIARAAFDNALAYAAGREAFDQKVLGFQGIQWYFADLATRIDAARLLVYEACVALDEHREIARYASEAKLAASQVATRAAEQAIQICGAYGVTERAPFGRYLRDAKAYEIAGGSSEILKNTIGKQLLAFAAHHLSGTKT